MVKHSTMWFILVFAFLPLYLVLPLMIMRDDQLRTIPVGLTMPATGKPCLAC